MHKKSDDCHIKSHDFVMILGIAIFNRRNHYYTLLMNRRFLQIFVLYQVFRVVFGIALTFPTVINRFSIGNAIPFPMPLIDVLLLGLAVYLLINKKYPRKLIVGLMIVSFIMLAWGQLRQIIAIEMGGVNMELGMVRSIFGYYLFFIMLTVIMAWYARPLIIGAAIIFWLGFIMSMVYYRIGYIDFGIALLIIAEAMTSLVVSFITVYLVREQKRESTLLNRELRRKAVLQEELVVSWERNRLARELHDTLAHSLSAISVQSEALKRLLKTQPDKIEEIAGQLHVLAHEGLNNTRSALQALRAAPIQDLGLHLALEKLAQDAASRLDANLSIRMPESPLSDVSPDIEHSIYRIAQEALENCVRHSMADQLSVSLAFIEDSRVLRLQIIDNGSGFNPQGVQKHRFGLLGMKERAELAGGDLLIDSAPGMGCRISCSISYQEDKND